MAVPKIALACANPVDSDNVEMNSDPLINAHPRKPARTKAAVQVAFRWTCVLLAVLLLIVAVLVTVVRVGLPLLGSEKSTFEGVFSDYVNSPVSIGELEFYLDGVTPRLRAGQVSIMETAERQVTFDELKVDVNLIQSLLTNSPVLHDLQLSGVDLVLDYTDQGEVSVRGIQPSEVTPSQSDESSGLDIWSWLQGANQVELRDARITLINAADNQAYQIQHLNMLAVNDRDLHQVRIDMQLPEQLGAQLDIAIDLEGDAQQFDQAQMDVVVKATQLDANALRHFKAGQFQGLNESTTGIAQLDARLNVELKGYVAEGQLQLADGHINVADVVNLDTAQPVLERISADVHYAKEATGWSLKSPQVALERSGAVTDIDQLHFQYQPNDTTAWYMGASGQTLSLDLAADLALSLFGESLPREQWLSSAQPTGKLTDWRVALGLVDGKPDLGLQSDFHQLGLNATGKMPGVVGLGGHVEVKQNVGTVSLFGDDMVLTYPQAYSQPLSLQQVQGELSIDLSNPQSTVLDGHLDINDGGLVAQTRLKLAIDSARASELYVQSQFTLEDIAHTAHYLPSKVLKPATSEWLADSLLSGSITRGDLLLFGDITEFPFDNKQGVFKVSADVANADIKYLPDWPVASKVNGMLELDGNSLNIEVDQGQIDALQLSALEVGIGDFKQPELVLSSTGSAPLADMVSFANEGPLRDILEPVLSDVSADGHAQMDLMLTVPLGSTEVQDEQSLAAAPDAFSAEVNAAQNEPNLSVKGALFLKGNALKMAQANLEFTKVNGAIGFTESGVHVNNLEALLFNQLVRIDSQTHGEGLAQATDVTVKGLVNADDVLHNYDIPLTEFVAGRSLWEVSLHAPMVASVMEEQGVTLQASSDLEGTELSLPAPLFKPRTQTKKLSLSTSIKVGVDESIWSIQFADLLNANVVVDEQGMRAFSASLGVEQSPIPINDGIRIDGVVDEFSMDGWVSSISTLIEGLPESDVQTPIFPVFANLKVQQLQAGIESLGSAKIRVNTDDDNINLYLQNKAISGELSYPREHWVKELPAKIMLTHVDKSVVDALDSAPVTNAVTTELDPRTLPPLEVHIKQLSWDDLKINGLIVNTKPTLSGLDIENFGFRFGTTQFLGSGAWQLADPLRINPELIDQHKTELSFEFESSDFGDALTELGFAGALNEGEGMLKGVVFWPGPLYKPAIDTMGGELKIDLAKGRILNVEPGAARLVGLFALQTIPRRLNLDFKDFVSEGLDYESIKGKVEVAHGIAHTSSVRLTGPIGAVEVSGESNLATSVYNQKIAVFPRVSVALPIIGVLSAGTPGVVGAVLVGGVLKVVGVDIDNIGQQEYELTGTWDEPILNNVPLNLESE